MFLFISALHSIIVGSLSMYSLTKATLSLTSGEESGASVS